MEIPSIIIITLLLFGVWYVNLYKKIKVFKIKKDIFIYKFKMGLFQ